MQSTEGENIGMTSKINGQTALHYAVTNIRLDNNKKVAYYLLQSYADASITNAQKNTPLHLTVASTDNIPDRTAMVIALVKNGAPINAENFQGNTLMHLAANAKNPEWIKGIIENLGQLLDMTLKNDRGFTPYEFAKQLGFQETSEALRLPIPPMPKAQEYNHTGLTGLMLAIIKGDQKQIEQMASTTQALNMRSNDEYKNSALHYAMIYDRLDALKTLMGKGASLTTANARGELPIHFLPRLRSPELRRKAATALLKKNPQLILAQNNRGDNLLHYIVVTGILVDREGKFLITKKLMKII